MKRSEGNEEEEDEEVEIRECGGRQKEEEESVEVAGTEGGALRGEGLEEGVLEDYTKNISLLEKFSTPLSASIVIYARDEGGYGPLYGF